MYTANGNLLINLLPNCNLMVCNSRTLLSDPQWTQVHNNYCFGHKSIIQLLIVPLLIML